MPIYILVSVNMKTSLGDAKKRACHTRALAWSWDLDRRCNQPSAWPTAAGTLGLPPPAPTAVGATPTHRDHPPGPATCLETKVPRRAMPAGGRAGDARLPWRRGSCLAAARRGGGPRRGAHKNHPPPNTTPLSPGKRGAATAQGALGWYRPSVGVPGTLAAEPYSGVCD